MSHWVVLSTDLLFFVLIGAAVGYALLAARNEPMRAPWREVGANRFAAASAVILAAYLVVALLDSLHFHPTVPAGDGAPATSSNEIRSVLDVVLTPLRTHTEHSYSAPFATRAFSKELIEREDGTTVRTYPALEYGGAHLEPGDSRARDIAVRTLRGALAGVALAAVFVTIAAVWRATRQRIGIATAFAEVLVPTGRWPLTTIWITLAGVFAVIGALAELAPVYHVLGTDKVGNDVLYQAIKSIRTGLFIGTLTTLVMLPFAISLGVAAGYFRGWVDDAIQYVYTTLSSIPSVLLIAAAVLLLDAYMERNADAFTSVTARADLKLLALCAILGITSWTSLCRLLRGEVLKLREIEFVQAARALGVPSGRILSRHLVPNVMHIVMITIVLDFSNLVLAEAVLSYINIGVDPTMESWGNMINSARLELAREPVVWWSLLAAFVFMFVLVLAANLFADAVRDAFDPRLRTQGR